MRLSRQVIWLLGMRTFRSSSGFSPHLLHMATDSNFQIFVEKSHQEIQRSSSRFSSSKVNPNNKNRLLNQKICKIIFKNELKNLRFQGLFMWKKAHYLISKKYDINCYNLIVSKCCCFRTYQVQCKRFDHPLWFNFQFILSLKNM